ncbi:hypothetical protein DPMN_016432 [Dreissena polymorpha]|uniref:Uncharacterized protein n=1 Tax=Dreissena polymorpha TaxID=45954 RepID=A0A9D4NFM3_DREPO|nr:hypothetical protein DPMN_016432 [Dreissena polymorpha]
MNTFIESVIEQRCSGGKISTYQSRGAATEMSPRYLSMTSQLDRAARARAANAEEDPTVDRVPQKAGGLLHHIRRNGTELTDPENHLHSRLVSSAGLGTSPIQP